MIRAAEQVQEANSTQFSKPGDEVFQWNYRILKFVGILFTPKCEDHQRIRAIFRFIAGYSMHGFMVFQAVFDLFLIRHDLEKVTLNICMTGLAGGVMIRNLLYLFHQSTIVETHRELREGKFYERDSETDFIFMEADRHLKRMRRILMTAGAFAIPSWMLMPFFAGGFNLPFRGWFPFVVEKYPNFYFAYSMQLVYMGYMAVSIVCCDLIAFDILLLVWAHYNILVKNIRDTNLFFNCDKKEMNKTVFDYIERQRLKRHFKQLVIHHHEIIKYVSTVENMFSPMLFLDLVGGTFFVSLLAFELMFASKMSTKLLAEGLVAIGALFTMFFYCGLGTIIEHMNYKVSQEIYATKWYNSKSYKSLKTFVLLLMNQSQRPHRITAWKLVPVNLPIFLSICEKIYNLLAVVPQLLKKYLTGA